MLCNFIFFFSFSSRFFAGVLLNPYHARRVHHRKFLFVRCISGVSSVIEKRLEERGNVSSDRWEISNAGSVNIYSVRRWGTVFCVFCELPSSVSTFFSFAAIKYVW